MCVDMPIQVKMHLTQFTVTFTILKYLFSKLHVSLQQEEFISLLLQSKSIIYSVISVNLKCTLNFF